MDGKTTIKYLQTYIKEKDYQPELLKDYFLKLSEEVGELSRAMRNGLKAPNSNDIKGTIDEELWDVIYYALAIANIYDIDMEQVIKVKSDSLMYTPKILRSLKYSSSIIEYSENKVSRFLLLLDILAAIRLPYTAMNFHTPLYYTTLV